MFYLSIYRYCLQVKTVIPKLFLLGQIVFVPKDAWLIVQLINYYSVGPVREHITSSI